MKKKLLGLFCAIFVCCLFLSCINVEQSVSYSNGKYQYHYVFSMNELLLALIGGDDYEIDDIVDSFTDEMQENHVRVNKFQRGSDVGFSMDFEVSKYAFDKDERSFLTQRQDNVLILPLFGGKEISEDDVSDEFTEAFFSDAKWTTYIGKSIVSSVYYVKVTDDWGYGQQVDFYSAGDSVRIDIPMNMLLFNDNKYTQLRVFYRN